MRRIIGMLAVCCGWRGLYAVAVYVLLEILVWGVNLWALSYLYVWALLFVAARLLWRMESSLSWGLLSGFFDWGSAPCAPFPIGSPAAGRPRFPGGYPAPLGPGPRDGQLCHGVFSVQASARGT